MSKNPDLHFSTENEMLVFALNIPGLQKLNLESDVVQSVGFQVYLDNQGKGFTRHTLGKALKTSFRFTCTSQFNPFFWEERGWSTKEAEETVKNLQRKNASKLKEKSASGGLKGVRSLPYFQKKYGEEKGLEMYLDKCQRSTCSKENMIRRHGPLEGLKKWDIFLEKKRKQISLEGFKERFGTEGPAKWEEYCNARRYCASLPYFVQKHGNEKGRALWERRNRNISMKNALRGSLPLKAYSEESQKLFSEIVKDTLIEGALFGPSEHIFFLTGSHSKRLGQNLIRPDFLWCKKVIEYQGSRWHANPNRYSAEDTPNPYRPSLTSKEIWDKDEIRKNILEELGYQVLIVWDSDYHANPIKVLEECKNFIRGKTN
jgi:G:T-mismatch repair DNA endonuclease (very short patch repair protein)